MKLFEVRELGVTVELVIATSAEAVTHAFNAHEYWTDHEVTARLCQVPPYDNEIVRYLPPSPCNRLCGGLALDVAAQTWPGA